MVSLIRWAAQTQICVSRDIFGQTDICVCVYRRWMGGMALLTTDERKKVRLTLLGGRVGRTVFVIFFFAQSQQK